MDPQAYFLAPAANEADLSSWSPLVPEGARILCTNLFGDAFLVDATGAVHMLSRSGASIEQVASSEEEFCEKLIHDEEGWQLRPLADRCAAAGKTIGEGQCYAFTTPPFLGGDYSVDNVWVSPWREWFALTADLYNQTKDLPEGASVQVNVVPPEPKPEAKGFFARLFN
jgi:hypothetical protein